jgi:hypothetical protein
MPFKTLRALGALLLLAATGCGDDGSGPTDPGGPSPSQAPMSAKLDGADWSSPAPLATRTSTGGADLVAVGGAGTGGTVSFAFRWIQGVDTYTIASGANANFIKGSDAWTAPAGGTVANPDGTSGTITVTSLTAERVTGTFQLTLKAQTGAQPDYRVFTEGQFDVAFF